MEIFNNREIALGIWLFVFAAFAISIKSVRQALPPVWQAICHPKILTPIFLMFAYVSIVVFALYTADLWTAKQLKNTILWTFSVAVVSMFRIPQIADDETYFRKALMNNFKIIAVLEFVIAFYTFSLLAELLIVPAVTFLVTLQAFSETEQKYRQVGQLLANLLTAIGFGLILYSGVMLATEPTLFFQAGTFSDFALPLVLTVLHLPFLFVFSLYMQYETLFTRIQFLYQTDSERRLAKRTALFGLHFRTPLLKRWLRYIQRHRPRELDEFRRSVRYVKTQAKNEKNPPSIPICKGWSPYLASKFLSALDLETGDYIQDGLDASQWYSSSNYLDVNGGPLPNNIAFYVEGDEQCATTLKLVANVNHVPSGQTLRIRLIAAVEKLLEKAVGCAAPSELVSAINDEVAIAMNVSGKRIDFLKESWPSLRGYELRFYLSNNVPQILKETPP